ncbi:MAG: 2-oxoacid:acceptor oxidoreductase family protein, partial [Methanomassiliicoccales archaeon]
MCAPIAVNPAVANAVSVSIRQLADENLWNSFGVDRCMDAGFNWMAGGPQGSGVDTAANIFGKACAIGGFHVYGRREYHSNIKGMHSYFHLRVSEREISANVNEVHLLAAFDAETIARHISEVVPGGGIVVDSRQLKTKILEIPALPPEFRSNFSQFMERNGIGETLQDLLDYASRMGIHVFPVVYTDLLYQVADSLSLEKTAKLNRMINVVTVGLSFGILGYDINAVKKALVSIFSEKSKLIEMNMRALEMAYNHAQENFRNFVPPLKVKESVKEERLLLSGNQAVAIGKALGGCRVQTYYPITPAADESEFIEAHEILETKESGVNAGVVVVQTEDEIAAVNMASGAALTGVRAATSTSGPGFS